MRKIAIYLIVMLVAGSIFYACDTIEEPYYEDNVTVWNGRKSLILDFTGQRCGFCPDGHRVIEQLQLTYPDAVVPIAVHCSFLGIAATSDTTQPFHYNFMDSINLVLGGDGMSSTGYFNITSQPIGVVNSFSPEDISAPGAWATNTAAFISLYPEFSIEIESDYSDSIIYADISVLAEIAAVRQMQIAVYIVESHIIEWQEDYSADESPIENYEHNHVLRASMNGAFGEKLNTDVNLSIGDDFEKSYNLKIKPDWNPENLQIIAFVYDNDSKEVLQAEEAYVQE
ncbi:MAG: Omp28-related outer membrane protein [Bacteroidota bacterium]|nr:Omp28-related outer membrane protein [Bacteroidota bacterium]